MLRSIALFGTAALLSSSVAAGPSAKFAATYNHAGDSMYVVSMAKVDYTSVDTTVMDRNAGYTLATIKVPQDKELLVGVSAEVGLTTDTAVKGKNGGAAKALADARARTLVVACPTGTALNDACAVAKPGAVTMSQRIQTLSATLGGVIESCTDGDLDGTIDIAEDCVVSDEEIGLILDTLSAHHFNFVLPNMDQGEYDIIAFFLTDAKASVDIDESTVILADDGSANVSAMAEAKAWIGSHMVTVQQVRATSNGVIDAEIVE